MTDDVKTPAEPALARLLFGWAFRAGAGMIALGVLAVSGAALVAAEYFRPRDGLRLPFEEQPAFYAAVGAGTVAGAILLAALLKYLLWRDTPYMEEAMDREDGDDNHA